MQEYARTGFGPQRGDIAEGTGSDQKAVGTAALARPKAYSYVRFSTPEQAKGDSLRRQTEQAEAWAKLHGLDLDTEFSFKDLGVSAFRSKNARTGALRGFLEKVEEGVIPKGSYLLVESLDRITRDAIVEANALFSLIIQSEINVVTLLDGKTYSRESINSNPVELIASLVIMMRGNEESATKSRRLLAVYERKRKDAGDGKLFTRALPAWLTWNAKTLKPELIPERANLLRDIFQKADTGWSKHRIARWLNERGVETWGTGKRKADYWHSSYIQKLLTNSAAIGTFTPHKALRDSGGVRKRLALDPIEKYFPAAISPAVFDRVSAQAKSRAARGRNAQAEPRSIFAGVLKCAHCGGTVTRVSKGEHVYLVCSRANQKAKGCRYLTVRYANAEEALRGENARAFIGDAPRGRDTAELEEEIRGQDVLGELLDEAQELLNISIREKSEIARQRLQEKEAEIRTERERLRELRVKLSTLTDANAIRRLEALRAALEREPVNVAEANKALRQAVSRIVLDPEQATLAIYWLHSEQPQEVQLYTRRYLATIFPPEPGSTRRAASSTAGKLEQASVSQGKELK
jgi:DNA invertase Pin-like site-specific DNA recombinase